jgi:hypothetical protein
MPRNPIIRQYKDEIEALLAQGVTHYEIAQRLPVTAKQVYDYAYWHKIDLFGNYRLRILREGLPNRLQIDDAFGYWFTGFVDGEGSLIATNKRSKQGHRARVVSLTITQRADDPILDLIQKTLEVGSIVRNQETRPTCGLKNSFVVADVKDVVEVILPIFDKYPLRSKKGKEYPYWRELAVEKYISTLGGYSTCCPCDDVLFDHHIEILSAIRDTDNARYPLLKLPEAIV